MASVLSALSPGSTISLKINGSPKDFIVLHQGNPDPALYDESCGGTWLQMKDVYSKGVWGDSTEYDQSTVYSWLNSTFLKYFDADVQEMIRPVKLPYVAGGTVRSGADGLASKLFLLSAAELGWAAGARESAVIPADGACLAYYQGCVDADGKRLAQYDGKAQSYWTRSPDTASEEKTWYVMSSNGGPNSILCYTSNGYRPALILPSGLAVDDDGSLLPNTPPTLTSPSGTSGTNLGIRNTPFLLEYTASDTEGGEITLTEQLDAKITRTLTAVSGTAQQFEAVKNSASFLPLANGAHTLQVTASDGMDSASLSMTFTKAVTSASLTMVQPLTASAPITVASLTVGGLIPADADYTVQVTNNALDPQPVWQDVTAEVREGQNILFENHTLEKSPAFNFRIQAARGTSGTGGYIDRVTGAFQ